MEKLEIRKRDGLACWKIDGKDVCPNTLIEADAGLTMLIHVEGQDKLTTKRSFTINSLLNPGHNTKLFGGKKPYGSCEIRVIDVSSDFKVEWALAGDNALACKDEEFDVDAKAVCFGEYVFAINDFFSFSRWIPMGDRDELSRGDLREFLRAQTADVAKTHIAPVITARGMVGVQAKLSEISENVREEIDRKFAPKGLEVSSFIITKLDFEPAHLINREALKRAKVAVKVNAVVNEGRRDDISVNKAQSEVDIGYINALKGEKKSEESEVKVFCSRCGELNNSKDNYCYKCGEALHKKN